jgi:hypothetical protein
MKIKKSTLSTIVAMRMSRSVILVASRMGMGSLGYCGAARGATHRARVT